MIAPAREKHLRIAALVAPFIVYLAGVALLGDWIIDDAGISFAYARNVAAGHGFVAQAGRAPVEGFSNFLWVVLLTPLFVVRAFDPVIVPRVLGAALVLGSFALVQRTLARRTGSLVPGLSATLLLAAAPPIVIWTASGLENGLTLLLLVALITQAIDRPPRWQVRSGALAALLAMTHPEGLLYATSGALVALVDLAEKRWPPPEARSLALSAERRLPPIVRDVLLHAAGFAAIFGPFLAFRWATFGLPLPHTYYAKRVFATPWDRLADMASHPGAVLAKLGGLLRGILGAPGPLVGVLVLAVAIALLVNRRLPREGAVTVAFAGLAIAGYVFMDDDWMGEFRFGTGAVLLTILALVTIICAASRAARTRGLLARLPGRRLVLAIVLLASFALTFPRIARFAANPTTPFRDVERSFARKADAYADRLGLARGSILLADVGAPLFVSRLAVIDAAGLCEPEVVRTLKQGTPVWLDHHPAFHDWVFERLRPTFISTHHFWTLVTALDDDPRFARDYVAIEAYEDAYVLRTFGRSMRSGDFVRRDALASYAQLDALRAAYRPPPRPDPFVVRLEEALFGSTSGDDDSAITTLRDEAARALGERNDPHRAATLLGRLLARRPSDLAAAHQRAFALDAAMRPDEARLEWQRVLDLAPPPAPLGAAARARLDGHLAR